MIFISAADGGGEFVHEGSPAYPMHNGMEVMQVIYGNPAASLSRLIADPACPDEVRQKVVAWLARYGVDIKVVRAT